MKIRPSTKRVNPLFPILFLTTLGIYFCRSFHKPRAALMLVSDHSLILLPSQKYKLVTSPFFLFFLIEYGFRFCLYFFSALCLIDVHHVFKTRRNIRTSYRFYYEIQ